MFQTSQEKRCLAGGPEGIEMKQKRLGVEPEITAKGAKKDLLSTKYQFPIMAELTLKGKKLA